MNWLIHLISEFPTCVVLGMLVVQLFVLTAVAEMLSRFALNGNARWICNLWLLATASLLALPAIHIIGGCRLTLSPVQEVAQDIEQNAGERDVSSQQVVPDMPSVASGAGSRASDQSTGSMQVEATAPAALVQSQAPDPMAASSVGANPVGLAASTAMPPSSRSTPWLWFSVAFLGYGGVSCLLLARLALGTCRLKNLVCRSSEVDAAEVIGWSRTIATQLGLANSPRVLSSQSVSMPLVCGWRRPTVLVPHDFGDWPAEQQQAVLWHELAHVKRGDLLAEFMARLVTIIYWIHPAAWFTAQRLRESMEVATDRHVLNSGNEPRQYARSLLAILQRVGPTGTRGLPAVAMSAAGDVEQRVRSILDSAKTTPMRRGPWLVALLGCLAVATSVRLQVVTATSISQDGKAEVVVQQEAATVSAAEKKQAASAATAAPREHDLIRRLTDCEVLTVEGDDYHAVFHVDGHVLTHDGQPVARAVVVLRESASARITMMHREDPDLVRGERGWNVRTQDVFARTTTDAEGRFQFDGVKSPALAPDWRNSWNGSIVVGHADFGIGWQRLGPKQERERNDAGLNLVLRPTSKIEGSFQTPEGEAISDTKVSISFVEKPQGRFAGRDASTLELSNSQLLPVATTNVNGTFRIENVPAGMVAIVGARPADAHQGAAAAVATSADVPLITRERHFWPVLKPIQPNPCRLVADPGFRIRGIIRDEQNTPIANASIRFGSSAIDTISNGLGRFELAQARYRLESILDQGSQGRLLVQPKKASRLMPQYVQVSKEQVLDPDFELGVSLARGTRVSGRILDQEGRPVANCAVMQFKDVRELPAGGRSDEDGRYEILLPPGEHTLILATDEAGFELPLVRDARLAKEDQLGDWLTKSITIDTEPVELDPITVKRTSELQIIVSLPGGKPAVGAMVSLYEVRTSRSRNSSDQWRESLGPSETANALGRVSIAPLGGQPSGQAFAEAYINARDWGYFGTAPLSNIKNNTLHIVLEKQGIVEGRVLRDGQPWPGVRLSISESRRRTNPDGSPTGGYTFSNHRQVSTDAQGVYRLALPVRKDYSVWISSLPDGSESPFVGRRAQVTSAGKTMVDNFNIVTASEQIAGVVTDASGNPVTGAQVRISSNKSAFWHGHRENSQPETDAAGRFVLRNVPAGTHDLWVSGPRRDGASRITTRLTAEAGQRDLRIVIDGPLPASGDKVDEAIASLEKRGAALTEMDERRLTATFSATPLSDADVKNLSTLSVTRELRVVTLRGKDFSDRDAELLSQIKGLRAIGLLKTRATEAAIEKLHTAHPDLRIVRTGGPYLGLALRENVIVAGVRSDSAAEEAGISVGDRLTKFAGHDITEIHDLLKLVSRSKPGNVVDVEIARGDESKSLKLKMGELTID